MFFDSWMTQIQCLIMSNRPQLKGKTRNVFRYFCVPRTSVLETVAIRLTKIYSLTTPPPEDNQPNALFKKRHDCEDSNLIGCYSLSNVKFISVSDDLNLDLIFRIKQYTKDPLFLETSVTVCQSTRRNIQVALNLPQHRSKKKIPLQSRKRQNTWYPSVARHVKPGLLGQGELNERETS